MPNREQLVSPFKFSRELIDAMIRNGNYAGLKIFLDKGHQEIRPEDLEDASQVAKYLQNGQPGGVAGRRGH